MLLPFKISKRNYGSAVVLAGDVGATKTDLSVIRFDSGHYSVLKEQKFRSGDYQNIIGLADSFLKNTILPDSICLGVAGPVLNGHAKLSNLNWEINKDELSDHFGDRNVEVINDLEAAAYGLALLTEQDLSVIQRGDENPIGNAAVIAPGTGLGEAGLYWDGTNYHPFATEGGHCDFASRDEFDFELHSFLESKFGHVSWERLICGPGILNIYEFLRDEKNGEEPAWLKEKIENHDEASVISQHTKESELCNQTMQLFLRYLAFESANLVLKLKATGGLFIGGGIAPKIISLVANDIFNSFFRQSGRMNYILERVPVKIILNTRTALLGAAFYGT